MEPPQHRETHPNLTTQTHPLANTKQSTTRAQTLENVWSLNPPHCEGPALRTSVVLPSGGGYHLLLRLFPHRGEAVEASPSFPLHLDFHPYSVTVLSISMGTHALLHLSEICDMLMW